MMMIQRISKYLNVTYFDNFFKMVNLINILVQFKLLTFFDVVHHFKKVDGKSLEAFFESLHAI